MPNEDVIEEHVFNDDLLINDKRDDGKTDLEWAAQQFPEIIYLLDCARLREGFKAYDRRANRNRDWVRGLGFCAGVCAGLSLLDLASEPVWHHASWTTWLALVLEVGGLGRTFVAIVEISKFKTGSYLHLIAELELANVDEMIGFLRMHHNTRLVLAQ